MTTSSGPPGPNRRRRRPHHNRTLLISLCVLGLLLALAVGLDVFGGDTPGVRLASERTWYLVSAFAGVSLGLLGRRVLL
jgi:hypothetical protein